MKGSLIILGFFSAGLLLGLYHILPEYLIKDEYNSYTLYLLILLVGVGIGADSRALQTIKSLKVRIFLVPLTTVLGTAIGVSLVYLLTSGLTFKEVQAVGSGYGYYSLSSIIITDAYSKSLGVVALISNVMREIITLLAAPIIAIYFGKIAPICSGGATTMDSTLPIIIKASGKEYAIVSLFHGIVLTILVPFFITLILLL